MWPDLRLDPRTKLALLLLMNVVVYGYGDPLHVYLGVALGVALLLAARVVRPVAVLVAIYAALFAIDALIDDGTPGWIVEVWVAVSLPFFVFLPTLVYGLLLLITTTISEVAAAMQKMRLPAVAMVPLLVLLRFAPALVQDFRSITDAMRLRGLIGRGNPLRAVEYVYVPLLLGVVRTGDQLTTAALTSGLGLHRQRTFVIEPRFRIIDAVAVAAMAAILVSSRIAAG